MTLCTGFDLCRAALAVTGISAPEQSVLMVLAIMANDKAQCWPAVNGPAGLTGKTKLSERAVQNATKALEAAGHIARTERPGRGMIYTVHPQVVAAVDVHYVYRVTDPATGEFYIGCRTAQNGDPARDSYMGSGRWFSRRTSDGASLAKSIIAVFADRKTAEDCELAMVSAALADPLCRNERTPAGRAPRTTCTPHEVRPAHGAPTPAPPAPKQPRTTTSPKASPSPKRARAAAIAFVPPSDIPEAEWEAFEDMRRRIKKPMTDKARTLAVERLRKLADDGWPPGDVLNHSTLNNYQGLFPPKDHRNGTRTHHDRSEPQNPMVRALRNAEARDAGHPGGGLQPRLLS